jgi:hypothetical protein
MVSDLASTAFDDLDTIARDAQRARSALDRGDVETAQTLLDDIETLAAAWEDPN